MSKQGTLVRGTVTLFIALAAAPTVPYPSSGRESGSPLQRLDAKQIHADDLWPNAPRELVAVVRGPTRSVAAVGFSPDMTLLAATAWDNTTRLWKLGDPAPREWAVLEGSPSGLSFSPDGKMLAAGSPGTSVILWDLAAVKPKKKRTLPGHKQRPFAVAFSPTGQMLATACNDPVLRIWKLERGDIEAWAILEEEKAGSLGVASLAFSSDGKKLAAGSFAGKHGLRIWEVAGEFMDEMPIPPVRARLVAFSPTEQVVAYTGSESSLYTWDVKRARTIKRLVLPAPGKARFAEELRSLAYSPDGTLIAAAGPERQVLLWDTASGKRIHTWTFPAAIKSVAFASDGHLAAGCGNGAVYVLRRNLK